MSVECCDKMCLVCLQEDLENGEEVATCPSCSLIVKVIYDKVSWAVLNQGNRIALLQHEVERPTMLRKQIKKYCYMIT